MNVLFVGNHLRDQGHYPGISYEIGNQLRAYGITPLFTSDRVNKFLRLFDFLKTILLDRKNYRVAQVDVYSGPAFWWAFMAVAALKVLRKPVVLTLHGGNLPGFAGKFPGFVRWMLRSAQAVTAPSQYLSGQMRSYREDLIDLPNPINLQAYPYRQRTNPRPVLIWLRAFHQVYHPGMAIRAAACLLPRNPGLLLTMIGPDKGDGSFQEAREQRDRLGLKEHVRFPGIVSKQEVPGWLDQADAFLNTSRIDNMPVSLLEAMASGLCIVSTRAGGIPYLLDDGVNGVLVPVEDAEAMAAAVQSVLDRPDFAARISENARKTAGQYDQTTILPRWVDLFNRLAE